MAEKEISFQVFEDNAGYVHMAIFEDKDLVAFLDHLEELCLQKGMYGCMDEFLNDLVEDPTCWKAWEVYEPIHDGDPTAIDLYYDCFDRDDIVAWGTPDNRKYAPEMGYNAAFLLGYLEDYNGEGYLKGGK